MRITLLLAIALFISSHMKGQTVIGAGTGYTTAKSPIFNLQVAYKFNSNLVYYNQLVHLTRRANVPQILGIRYGYNIGSFQPNAGFDYHLYSDDKYRDDKPYRRFHFAFGITKYFISIPLRIDFGISKRFVIACIGFYKILE